MFESAKFIISRLARDRTSLVGACLIVALVLIAIFAVACSLRRCNRIPSARTAAWPSMLHFWHG